MAKQEMFNCPLCQGQARISRAELMSRLSDKGFREEVETYLADLSASATLAEVGVTTGARDFQKEVHCWNPQLPIWRRSPKE